MEKSASRWNEFCAVPATKNRPRVHWNENLGALNGMALHSLLRPTNPLQPLLKLQRLADQETSVICVCNDFRQAQGYFMEYVRAQVASPVEPFLIHDMMPGFQHDYLFEQIRIRSSIFQQDIVILFTTRDFFPVLSGQCPALLENAVVLTTDGEEISVKRIDERERPQEPVVSCICLREGHSGRWLLMDHDAAATVQPDITPPEELVPRLAKHSVDIKGHRVAPYLAMMFDVPDAWKVYPGLALMTLLIFRKNVCVLGCHQPGIPSRIIWSDLAGLIFTNTISPEYSKN